jgi:hypothetical protein
MDLMSKLIKYLFMQPEVISEFVVSFVVADKEKFRLQ